MSKRRNPEAKAPKDHTSRPAPPRSSSASKVDGDLVLPRKVSSAELKQIFGQSDEQFEAMMDHLALVRAKKAPLMPEMHERYVRALFSFAMELAARKRAKREARRQAKVAKQQASATDQPKPKPKALEPAQNPAEPTAVSPDVKDSPPRKPFVYYDPK